MQQICKVAAGESLQKWAKADSCVNFRSGVLRSGQLRRLRSSLAAGRELRPGLKEWQVRKAAG